MLIREEEVYADRIRGALVFTEAKLERAPGPLLELDQSIRDARRQLYKRPESLAEMEVELPTMRRSRLRSVKKIELPIPGPTAYSNPPVDTRRTVDDNDALFSQQSLTDNRVMFTYEDLMATKEGRKMTTVRSLRRLANLWLINPKLNKAEMLSQLITQYARRYPEEVKAYESRRSVSRKRHVRRRGGGRR